MRVVLIKGESAYDALRVFIDEVGQAFSDRGFETVVIDGLAEADLTEAFRREAALAPTELVFTFNILSDYRDPDGRSLGQVFDAPHVVQHVDYPLSHWVLLDKTARETALLVIDPSHVEAIQAVYGAGHFAHVGFSPHGAIGRRQAIEPTPAAFSEARPMPLLFPGTFYEPPRPWWEAQQPVIRAMFQRAADIALSQEWGPPLAALDVSLAEMGLDPESSEVTPFRKLATYVHEHVRAQRRQRFLNAAAEVGLPLHVYGKGYDVAAERYPNLVFGGEVGFPQMLDLMRSSQLVLNINANFGRGSHERPLTALLAGAAAATDQSDFYQRAFDIGEELLVYRWSALEDDLARIKQQAAEPELLWSIAQRGQAVVEREHRWEARVDAILAAAEEARRFKS